MAISGTEVLRSHDEFGAVMVYDSAELRILSFDGHVEQSCVAKSRPWRLHYAYTQAMMLGLLFQPRPETAAVLGLGGGSIARTLLHFYPQCQVSAVELRQAVVDIAREWFFLPDTPKLDLRVDRAENWLLEQPPPQDLIFTDLFHVEGMEWVQVEQDYLEQCKASLSPSGVLVVNMWDSNREDDRATHEAFREVFGNQVLMLPVMGGNRIVLAFAQPLRSPGRRKFMQLAEQIGTTMEIPLARFARLLWAGNTLLKGS